MRQAIVLVVYMQSISLVAASLPFLCSVAYESVSVAAHLLSMIYRTDHQLCSKFLMICVRANYTSYSYTDIAHTLQKVMILLLVEGQIHGNLCNTALYLEK